MPIPIEDSLDLHAFAPADIPSVVDEYVRAAHTAGLREVRLVHGRGQGIQRGVVQQVLDRHHLVAACRPRRMTVVGDFSARGGIKTEVTARYEKPPK